MVSEYFDSGLTLLSTDKYLFKERDLLKISKSGSEATSKGVASLHLKPISSKSPCTGTIKNIIDEAIFEWFLNVMRLL